MGSPAFPPISMRKTFVILALSLGCAVTYGQETVSVEGGFDCGVWAIARKEDRAKYLEPYLLGLIDGLALGLFVEVWRAGGAGVTREQAYDWMDKYCAHDPHRMLAQGAQEFVSERIQGTLKKRAK